jgi:hypothetical protein
VARVGCCSALSIAVDHGVRLDKAGLGRSKHDADVAAVGVGRACASASDDRLCRNAPCFYQAGRHPLGLELKAKGDEAERL